jgi:protein-tyrosine phosphatase
VELVVVFCAEKPSLVELLIESGVYLQFNCGNFIGRHGRAAASTAWKMAANGWIHCMATDSHDAGRFDAGDLKTAEETLKNLIGPDNLRLIAHENPRRISRGEMPRPLHEADLAGRLSKARS